MMMTQAVSQRPMFATRSRLAVARDVAVLAVCVGIVLGFLIEIWAPSPRNAPTPAAVIVSTLV